MNAEPIPPVTVLLYHDVLPAGSPQPPDKGNIAVDRLCEHVQALRARGFQFIDLATAFTLLDHDPPPREPPKCVLTFDDAMQGLYDCWPELAPVLDATVSVFVITAYELGSKARHALRRRRKRKP